MADQKISELTELTSAIAVTDLLAVVDSSESETKKITLANLPLTIAQFASSVPYTVDIQNGVEQTRNLTTITDSDGYAFTSQPSSIYIGTNVTSIGSNAFYSSYRLTSIIIPNSVTNIGNYAFFSCTGLTSVTIGNSVETIGSKGFYYCTGLTSLTIPDSVELIGSRAFYSCSGLPSITIGNSVTSIGDEAFGNCYGMSSLISLAVEAPTLGTNVFTNTNNLTQIIVPIGSTPSYVAKGGGNNQYGGLNIVEA
jgi:hypothetical protein